MKKYVGLLNIFLVATQALHGAGTMEEKAGHIEGLIISAYTNAFGQITDTTKFTKEQIDQILNAIENVKKFVTENSTIAIWWTDALLTNSMKIIEKNDALLIDAVRQSRAAHNNESLQVKTQEHFNDIIADMNDIINKKLSKNTYISPKRRKCQSLLIHLAEKIHDAARHSLDVCKRRNNKNNKHKKNPS